MSRARMKFAGTASFIALLFAYSAAWAEPLDVHRMREDIWKQVGGVRSPSDLARAKTIGRQLETQRDAVMQALRKHLEGKGLKPPVWSGGLPSKGAGVLTDIDHTLKGRREVEAAIEFFEGQGYKVIRNTDNAITVQGLDYTAFTDDKLVHRPGSPKAIQQEALETAFAEELATPGGKRWVQRDVIDSSELEAVDKDIKALNARRQAGEIADDVYRKEVGALGKRRQALAKSVKAALSYPTWRRRPLITMTFATGVHHRPGRNVIWNPRKPPRPARGCSRIWRNPKR